MAETLIAVIGASLLLYLLFGGADFGAGILELVVGPRAQPYVDRALSPVWETNHVWLILAVVLTFVGFPSAYVAVSTYLHVPLSLALLGIVARGVAFTFRHYDPAPPSTRRWYTWVFKASSVLTPFFLGVVFAGIAEGQMHDRLEEGFFSVFVSPWVSPLAGAVGLFTCALCVFLAASLLAAERGPGAGGQLPYLRVARGAHLAAISLGGLVFAVAWQSHVAFAHRFVGSPVALGCMGIATALIPVVAWSFGRGAVLWLRLAVAAQVATIVAGFGVAQLPVLVAFQGGESITYVDAAAPATTLRLLLMALGGGAVLIGPGIVYLMRVYKSQG